MKNERLPLDEKPWYASGLAFECTQCGDCCSGPEEGYVWVTPEEPSRVFRRGLYLFGSQHKDLLGLRSETCPMSNLAILEEQRKEPANLVASR